MCKYTVLINQYFLMFKEIFLVEKLLSYGILINLFIISSFVMLIKLLSSTWRIFFKLIVSQSAQFKKQWQNKILKIIFYYIYLFVGLLNRFLVTCFFWKKQFKHKHLLHNYLYIKTNYKINWCLKMAVNFKGKVSLLKSLNKLIYGLMLIVYTWSKTLL